MTTTVRSTISERPPFTGGLHVLWIDDEVSVPESSRRNLEANGFHLTVALDADTAVVQATHGHCDLIILDLRLGKARGLEVLRDIRAAGAMAPVIVLTAYGESDSAFQAGRLGVAAYHHKPLVGRPLLQAIRQAAAPPVAPASGTGPASSRGVEAVTSLLLDNSRKSSRSEAARWLARALADPAVTLFESLALSMCFRANQEGLVPHPAARRATASLARLSRDGLDARLLQAITIIADSGAQWRSLRAEQVAAIVGTEVSSFWRLLHRHLGLSFGELTRAIVLRRAIVELASTDDHIRQIAYGLGYEHSTSFARDFRRFLGINPGAFRILLNQTGAQPS